MQPASQVGYVADDADDADRFIAVYRLLSQVFIEMDDGDKRFLRTLSLTLFGNADDYALTIPHFWALVHLGGAEGRTMAELATLLICDKSNVTAIVDRLEERQWVERQRGKAGDRRFMRVLLTDAGRAIRQQVMAAHRTWVHRRFAVLSAEQCEQFTSLLQLVHARFELDPEAVLGETVERLRLERRQVDEPVGERVALSTPRS